MRLGVLVSQLVVGCLASAGAAYGQMVPGQVAPEPIPRRGAAIEPPNPDRKYDKARDRTYVSLMPVKETNPFTHDFYGLLAGYAFSGGTPTAAIDTVLLRVQHSHVFSEKFTDTTALTLTSDTLQLVLQPVRHYTESPGGNIIPMEFLVYLVPLESYRRVFEADSAEARVLRRTLRIHGRAIEQFRWLGDTLAAIGR
jgi:hypothetical protein